MENLFLTFAEHRYLRKHKLSLEINFNVKIILPEEALICTSDITYVSISGDKHNIEDIKNVLKQKSEEIKRDRTDSKVVDYIPLVTLSDSDSDTAASAVNSDHQSGRKKRKRSKKSKQKFDGSKSVITVKKPAIEASGTTMPLSNCHPNREKMLNPLPQAEEFIGLSITSSQRGPRKVKKIYDKKKFKQVMDRPLLNVENFTPTHTNTMNVITTLLGAKESQDMDDSIIIIEETEQSEKDLLLNNKMKQNEASTSKNADDSIIILEESITSKDVIIPRPISKDPKLLRPIVIDGSNVAREHGKVEKTYSSKGIQISIDYFLKRGHTNITAFVPNFRRHKTLGLFPTTDADILEDLAKSQRVVFTPSRKLNGTWLTCYDDRFIVELAASNGGVILSNDNYRDIMRENDSFKKTVEERLLMFCFVGDMIMIPSDPLGKHGPCLDDFLSFPEIENSSPT